MTDSQRRAKLYGVIASLHKAQRYTHRALVQGYSDSRETDRLLAAVADACGQAHKALVAEYKAMPTKERATL